MAEQVVILGANGRFGRNAAEAFAAAGWEVLAGTRSGRHDFGFDVAGVAVDAFDSGSVARAADGCPVIVNALNPPYERWTTDVPRMTESVLAAAGQPAPR